MTTKTLSIIYVYYNTPTQLAASLASLLPQVKDLSYEVFIVNNASPTPLPLLSKEIQNLTIMTNTKNEGYGKAVNQAVAKACGEFLLVLNSDVIFTPEAIPLLLKRIKADPTTGVIGPQFVDTKGVILPTSSKVLTLLDACIVFSPMHKLFPKNPISKRYFLQDFDRKHEATIPTISGACMLFPSAVFKKIGGFDPRFFLYFEEIDICARISQKGYKIIFFPKATIIHTFGTSSRSKADIQQAFEKSRYQFLEKYYGKVPAVVTESFLRVSNWVPQLVYKGRN